MGAVEHEEQADDSPTPQRGGGKNAAIVFLMAAVIALGLVALHQYEQLTAWKQASPLTESTWNGDRWESRWRHNNQLDSIALDEDGNGVSETVWIYDREGTLVGVSYDANQNGVTELSINLDPEGKERVRLIDANENLITERYEYPARDGVREIWLDADEDERYERYEFVDAETGEVLDAFADRGREGYVRVK